MLKNSSPADLHYKKYWQKSFKQKENYSRQKSESI